jgi:GNAT superfamily N-acetyltransferase
MSGESVTIRRAVPADAPEIAHVHVAGWRAAYRGMMPDAILDSLDEAARARMWKQGLARSDCAGFVAKRDGAIVAFIFVAPSRDADADRTLIGEVSAIYVLPHAWRGGVGAKLMAEGMRFLAGRGFGEVTLWVLDRNARARAFYQACGFAPDGGSKHDPELAVDELRYRCRLTPL